MNCIIVTSTTPGGARIITRHYSYVTAWLEIRWRELNGHTNAYLETIDHDVIYAG